MLNRRALLAHLLHLDLISMIGPECLHAIATQPTDLEKLTGSYFASGVGNQFSLAGSVLMIQVPDSTRKSGLARE